MMARMLLFLALCLQSSGCDDSPRSTDCTIIQGREVDLEGDCTVGIVELACVDVDYVFLLTGHECRVGRDGRVFVNVTAPSSFVMADFVPCPPQMGVVTLGGYTAPCPPGEGK